MSPEPQHLANGQYRFVAVVDIGKTNAKVVLHDLAERRDVKVATRTNTVLAGPPYPHFDVEAIFSFILASLRDIDAVHPVEAVSITTHGAAGALVDDDGLVLPVMDYEFDLSGPESLAYDRLRPPFEESFSPRMANGLNLGRQIFFQQARFPKDFARARHILGYPQYWAFRLTGVAAFEATSFGCHTDLWAPMRAQASSMASSLGWGKLFAPQHSAFDVLGPLQPEILAAAGMDAGRSIPVHCGIHDSNASLLPHLLSRPTPFCVVSTGTWAVTFAVGGGPSALDSARDTLVNVDAFGRPVPSALFMGGREFDMLTRGRAVVPDEASLAAVIEGDIMALPSFVAGTGPFPTATGRWTADPDGLTEAERSAAASLYVALMTTVALGLAGGDGPTIVEGPFARNALITRALALLTERPVLAPQSATGTSAGAALLAAGSAHRSEATPAGSAAPKPPLPIHGLDAYAERWTARVAATGTSALASADDRMQAAPAAL